ncbi:MAG: four helix bundle protein [Ignavibacteriales bacterium]|nr:four helix bundle protein [Ignavibacteriales bacterium]
MQDYHNLKVWEKAHHLALDIYRASNGFPKNELYGITSQLRRACVSVSANIVEGCGRRTRADFKRFLTISLGSTNETEYFLLLSKDLGFVSPEVHEELSLRVIEIRKMLLSLIDRVGAKP